MATVKKVQLPALSMFSRTPVYQVGENVVLGLQQPVVLPAAGDNIYTVPLPMQNRLDKISTLFYKTPQLWWAIAQVNNIVDPLHAVPAGTQLRIPNRARLPVS